MHRRGPDLVLTVAVYFMHVLFRDATDHALLNDFGVFANHMLDDLEVFHCNLGSISSALAFRFSSCLYQWLDTLI